MEMTFTEYAQTLTNEKTNFVKDIAKLTVASEQTVYRWLSGEFVPSKARRDIIAEYLNTTADKLWLNVESVK